MRYYLIDTEDQILTLISKIEQKGEVVFDLETTSLSTHSKDIKIIGAGFCCSEQEAYYIPVIEDKPFLLDYIKQIAENDIPKIGHNIKYDARVMHRFNSSINNISFDTLVASYCLVGDQTKHNLDDLTLDYLNHVKIRTKDLIPKKSKTNQNPHMGQVPIPKVAVYCCEDVFFTYKLYLSFKELLDNNQSAYNLFYKTEMPLLPVLIEMECNGVKIDKPAVLSLKTKLAQMLTEHTETVNTAASREIVITKPNDIAKLLYEELKVQGHRSVPSTPTGRKKTNQETLELFKDDKVVASILTIKKLGKLLNTYIASFPQYISDYTGLLHASFNQTVTSTGRLSSSAPNLQNQPSRDQLGREIRRVFISRWDGGQILSADYSQAELRILAHMADEPVLIDVYNTGGDAHLRVAARITKKEEKDITPQERTYYKTINFGILYGMGPSKLALTLGIPKTQAEELIKAYLGTMTGVSNFLRNASTNLLKTGYTETFFGRRRYIPKIYSSYKLDRWAALREAANHIIQGTNADIIKKAMRLIYNDFHSQKLLSKLILQVHDELVFDVHPKEIDIIKPLVIQRLESITQFKVPMIAEAKYGITWADAH